MNKLNILLFVLVVLSALAVVSVQDSSRESFIALEKENQRQADLEEEYRRLQWQQAKLANHDFIKEAAQKQQLQAPTMQNTRIIRLSY
ncbi:cell division protein FtsL [Eikenella sp. S3360]|uniref:Cell division protein FtsL n=1 Tax=Eikenella glucosivorans TaxID=2766967 RepID=A0ABS0NAC3_9NEIS|nr:cell division protein FtsL [Eikenella glucosivorans]MBH5329271.1 cell division protein FtsL [Eikenella glucosivorans]